MDQVPGREVAKKAVRVRISGRVQGVWFRAWTTKEATRHGLDGWVRNRSDGSVEALLSGPADAVDAMIAACRHGPPMARVADVAVEIGDRPAESGFRQLPTA